MSPVSPLESLQEQVNRLRKALTEASEALETVVLFSGNHHCKMQTVAADEALAALGDTASEALAYIAREALSPLPEQPTDADGWIEWRGGKRPARSSEMVDVQFADGEIELNEHASEWCWAWSSDLVENGTNIVAWRLAK
jgi:hypothetical protein